MPELSYISEPLRAYAVPLDVLRKDPRNARLHPDRNLHAIRLSLRKFGQQKPIVLADDGLTIITGNGTFEAAALEGWTHIAAVTSNLNGRDATAYGLADNRTGETAEWDFARVGELVKELSAFEYDVAALGWQSHELEPLLAMEWRPATLEPMATTPEASKPATDRSETGQDDAGTPGAPNASDNAGGRGELKYVPFTDDQHEIVTLAVGKFREIEGDDTIPEGRAIELILADWLSGQ
jgi:hypothetical protein